MKNLHIAKIDEKIASLSFELAHIDDLHADVNSQHIAADLIHDIQALTFQRDDAKRILFNNVFMDARSRFAHKYFICANGATPAPSNVIKRLAFYGLTPAFLLEKVAERKAAGKPFDLSILETTLHVAKEKATKDFAGFFYTVFVKRDVFQSPYAQERGQAPRQPSQDAPQFAARVNAPVQQKMPYNANTSVTENLRPAMKSAEEQAAHYQQIAAPIPADQRLAIDVKVLSDGLKAMKASFLAGHQSAAQARAGVTALLGGFAPEVWQAAESTIQDVMRAFDAPVLPKQPPVSQERRGTLPGKVASMARGIGARA